MLYQVYQAQADFIDPMRNWVGFTSSILKEGVPKPPYGIFWRHVNAALELFSGLAITHQRPNYGIQDIVCDNTVTSVTEEVVFSTSFANLLHFRKDTDRCQPKVLVVAPMSGHFSTLLRHTVEILLRDHDVYIIDWKNSRDIPISAGRFGFDDYIEHVIMCLEQLGPQSHVIGVCQPAVAVLAATALMAEDNNQATPCSMILMAGPIDTRCNPTKVNIFAKAKDISWFERKMIGVVPWRYRGAGRRVYPGFMQLTAFMAMNLDKHIGAHMRHFRNLAAGDLQASGAHRQFYDEYLAVMDLPAEFYLETVDRIFMRHELAKGELTYRGRVVRPSAIRNTCLLTIEGERDDICGLGQTSAALDLCSNLSSVLKRHHTQSGVGHYGVFSGRRWEAEIYPVIREVVRYSMRASF